MQNKSNNLLLFQEGRYMFRNESDSEMVHDAQ